MAAAVSSLRCNQKRVVIVENGEKQIEDTKSWLLQTLLKKVLVCADFFDHLVNRLRLLLEQKEDRAPVHMKSMANSLIQQAANDANLAKYSTFSRSLVTLLKATLTPILAALVSFLDTNFNLNLPACELGQIPSSSTCGHLSWIGECWLRMLADPEATLFTYSQVLHLTQDQGDWTHQTGQLEVDVMFFPERRVPLLSPRIPFSFLIYQAIQELHSKVTSTLATDIGNERANEVEQPEAAGDLSRIRSPVKDAGRRSLYFLQFFYETPIGRILFAYRDHDKDLLEGYTQDFLSMQYNACCSQEIGIVAAILRSALKFYFAEIDTELASALSEEGEASVFVNQIASSELRCIPLLHVVYMRISNRLELLSKFMQIANDGGFLPECARFLSNVEAGRELYNNCDLLAARTVLEQLNKQGEEITKAR